MTGSKPKRRSAATVLLLAATLLLTLPSPPVASMADGPPSGEWVGFYSYDSGAVFVTDDGDVPVNYAATGGFEFVTANGFLRGNYTLYVDAELVELGTTGKAVANGDLSGPATEADMKLLEMVVAAEASGITMELAFTGAELGNPVGAMTSTGGSCSQVDGIWNQEFSLGMEAGGNSVDQLTGTWVALRIESLGDSDPATIEAEMNSLTALGQEVLDDVRSGTVNPADLRDYLAVAEGAVVSGTRRTNCDEGVDSGLEASFRSFAAATVDSILVEAALDIDSLDSRTFLALLRSGYRTGSFETNTELRDFYEAEFDQRVAAALASGNVDDLQVFLAAASQLGEDEAAAAILDVLTEVGG